MDRSSLTHLWLEDPLMEAALGKVPPGVKVLHRPLPPTRVPSNLAEADAILAVSAVQYNGPLMDAAPNLRIIARAGIGLDNVDVKEATRRGIVVTTAPDGPTESTAEHTVAMLLALAKNLLGGARNVAEGRFGPRKEMMGVEVQGKTLGLVGLGRIGRRVAEIARAGLRMRILAHDPFVPPEAVRAAGAEPAALDDLLSASDFVSLHLPLTPETRGLLDRDRIGRMKPSAYLLNLSRGGLLDEGALLDALDRGVLAGAGLDVFDPEPPPPDARIRRHPKVLPTPHTASVTREGRLRTDLLAVEAILAFFRGERPPAIVNPEAWAPPTP